MNVMLVFLARDIIIGSIGYDQLQEDEGVHCGGVQVICQSSRSEQCDSNVFNQCKHHA
jgi:hypothetical protein